MKNYVKLFESFINEGGWATVKTQETVIRPQIIKDAVKKIQVIAAELNAHYRSLQMPELDFTRPIGSGTWYEEDLVSQPDKVYGDVDFMVVYPVIRLTQKSERDDEIATVKLYNREMLDFLEKKRYSFIEVTETRKISSDTSVKFVMQVQTPEGAGWIQVDLVVTHTGYRDWAIFRMTPIRNVKGFVLGNLYSSFGEVLELSIQPRGVRAKFIGTQMVALAKRKDVEEVLVSRDINTFMSDIARFFWEQSGGRHPYREADSLKKWRGIDPKNPRLEDLVDGIRGVADTLDALGEFGTVIKYSSSRELLDAVRRRYAEKMNNQKMSDKFSKASTPAAIAARDRVMATIDEYVSRVDGLLG
jgi:hypothetical protein